MKDIFYLICAGLIGALISWVLLHFAGKIFGQWFMVAIFGFLITLPWLIVKIKDQLHRGNKK